MKQQKNHNCPICFQKIKLNLQKTPCNHYFHPVCINSWLNTSITCPLCRFNIKNPSSLRKILTEDEWYSLGSIVNERLPPSKYIEPFLPTNPENNLGGVFENNIYLNLHSGNAANSFPSIN